MGFENVVTFSNFIPIFVILPLTNKMSIGCEEEIEMRDRKNEFFDIVRARSGENEKALNLLLNERCYALIGAIIRMELDSLIRVYNFNNVDSRKQEQLLNRFFASGKWPNTDSNMVKSMSRSLGWTEHIYEFCCAFVHLSPYHDWASDDTIPNLTQDKRHLIVNAIRSQQYDPTLVIDENFGFTDLILFAPHIFNKLRDNLLYEMR